MSVASTAASTATEGEEASFAVTLSGEAANDVVLGWTTGGTGDTATSGDDYTAVTAGSLTIAKGQTAGTIAVTTLADTLAEAAETFTVTLTGTTLPDGVTLGTATATGTITDDNKFVNLCGRTEQVRTAILAWTQVSATECASVPASELAEIASLDLTGKSISSLQAATSTD